MDDRGFHVAPRVMLEDYYVVARRVIDGFKGATRELLGSCHCVARLLQNDI